MVGGDVPEDADDELAAVEVLAGGREQVERGRGIPVGQGGDGRVEVRVDPGQVEVGGDVAHGLTFSSCHWSCTR